MIGISKEIMLVVIRKYAKILALLFAVYIGISLYYYSNYFDRQLITLMYLIIIFFTFFVIFTIYVSNYLIPEIIHDNRNTIEKILSNIGSHSYKSTSSSGIERIYNNQGELMENYIKIVNEARYGIDILGASFMPFFWYPNFESATLNAIRKGVRFRVLVMDPSSNWSEYLSQREKRSNASLLAELERSLNLWKELKCIIENETTKSNDYGSIEIRTYRELAFIFLMIVDDTIFFAPYLDSASFLDSPWIEISSKKGAIHQSYKRFFDNIWHDTSIYPAW